MLELEREKSGGTTSSSDAGDNQPARRGRGRPPGSSRLRPKSLLKEREKSLGSRSKPSEETKKVSKSVKLEVTFNPSTSDVPSLTIDPLLSPQLAESLSRKGKDLRYNSAENIDAPDSTKPTTSASKRRVSSSSVHAQHQPAFAPMNLENTLESFQYILDKGGVRHQLSLRETARIDVATTQYNIFKEWASKSELKQLVAELILCRSDLLERQAISHDLHHPITCF